MTDLQTNFDPSAPAADPAPPSDAPTAEEVRAMLDEMKASIFRAVEKGNEFMCRNLHQGEVVDLCCEVFGARVRGLEEALAEAIKAIQCEGGYPDTKDVCGVTYTCGACQKRAKIAALAGKQPQPVAAASLNDSEDRAL